LDSDKFKESIKWADKFRMLGMNARALITPHDPKVYTEDQLKALLEELNEP
jgi:hypothetical protein